MNTVGLKSVYAHKITTLKNVFPNMYFEIHLVQLSWRKKYFGWTNKSENLDAYM